VKCTNSSGAPFRCCGAPPSGVAGRVSRRLHYGELVLIRRCRRRSRSVKLRLKGRGADSVEGEGADAGAGREEVAGG
jgi:hypothetical protein